MTTGFLFASLFAFLLLGMPIAIGLGLASVLTILFFANDSLASLALKFFQTAEHYTLLAIPYFILAGNFMTTGGVARRMIDFATSCVAHLRGGLAIASVMACMLFSAVSGSSPATVVAVGSIVIAGMVRSGYSLSFASGVICNAGTLGILIPPSIVMVVYAAATESSVGRMFMAGVIPGILLGLMLIVAIWVIATIKDLPRQERRSWSERGRTGLGALWGLLLIVIILGGIYGGVFTPTEAAAVSAVYAFFAASFIYRDMGPLQDRPGSPAAQGVALTLIGGIPLMIGGYMSEGFSNIGVLWVGLFLAAATGLYLFLGRPETGESAGRALIRSIGETLVNLPGAMLHRDTARVLVDSGKVTVMLMFIIANAFLFAHVLTTEQIPQNIAAVIADAELAPWQFLLVVNILLLVAGNFMEPSAIILILAPILFPIAMQLGIDPIHLGIIMVVNMEIGMVTPPVGLNLFVTAGITGMGVMQVVRAALPWLMVLLTFLVIVTYVPLVSLWLPDLLFGAAMVQ
ncbi:TRAP transporter large permease [Marinimicrococcus flavescens]|uniref:TRAP transporter large permease protein n=1 Tax=Marinimicrococcus flavescens TaxID=3031815 RepID=A0AAP3XT20_9PROT|nr:TRAP transporter large permease [Marinimicrococcus flavescens]